MPPRLDRSKEDRGKGKALDEPQKNMKVVHISDSLGKLGTTVSHSSKDALPPKLSDFAIKAIKIEMVWWAEEKGTARKVAKKE